MNQTTARARSRHLALGLDLAGSPRRRTGYCLLGSENRVTTGVLYQDQEITSFANQIAPAIVSIDAPLSLPRGRRSLAIPGPPHFRQCDLELRRMQIPFFPISLGPMRTLTRRGIQIKRRLRELRIPAIESYPGAAQDVLGFPRKSEGVELLRQAILKYGFRGDVERETVTHDELDALFYAWVARQYLTGRAVLIGDEGEGQIALPHPDDAIRFATPTACSPRLPPRRSDSLSPSRNRPAIPRIDVRDRERGP